MKLKYLALFENYTSEEYPITLEYPITFFIVDISYDDNVDNTTLYKGVDIEEAKEIFNKVDNSDTEYDVDATAILKSQTFIYKWINNDDSYEIIDYPLEDYYHDKDLYKLLDTEEYEILDTTDIDSAHKLNDIQERDDLKELEEEIITYIKSLSKESKFATFLNSTFYALLPYKDGYIQVRVADHFFNLQNIHLGKDVRWDYLENHIDERRNIYGFLSIHILGTDTDYYKDRRRFRSDFKYRKRDSEHPDLIQYITIDYENINDMDYITEINDSLEAIKDEIDNCHDIFDKKYEDGDYIEFEY